MNHIRGPLRIFKRHLVTAPVIVTAIAGLMSIYEYNVLPATIIFESIFFALPFLLHPTLNRQLIGIFFGIALYISYGLVRAILISDVDIFDFLVSYKAYIYILVLSLYASINNKIFSGAQLSFFLRWLLLLFGLKYAYSISLGIIPRPGIFTENNFELLLVFMLAATAWSRTDRTSVVEWLAVVLLVIMSGSRSAALALLPLMLATKFSVGRTVQAKANLLKLLSLITVVTAVGFVIIARSDEVLDIESIDRFQFMQIFLNETSDWSFIKFLVGAEPLTHLSAESCNALIYYEPLFSFKDNGTCYAVVLHSMVLRSLFDHGLLGFMAIFISVWLLLRYSKHDKSTAAAIVGILLANSMSVSSFNSIYAALPLAIALLSKAKLDSTHIKSSPEIAKV